MFSFFNKTGGMIYHVHAHKYKNVLWKDYHKGINEWLSNWQPKKEKLALIGPSAGYSLNDDFLNSFKEIKVYDPDPLAKILFKRQKQSKVFWKLKPAFCPEMYSDIESKEYAFLFCNLLGQLGFTKNFNPGQTFSNLEALKSTSWASFHDLYSFKSKLLMNPELLWKWPSSHRGNDEELLAQFVRTPRTEVSDHHISDLVPNLDQRKLFYWQRVPQYHHIIEAIQFNC